jgi:hypothetical protein
MALLQAITERLDDMARKIDDLCRQPGGIAASQLQSPRAKKAGAAGINNNTTASGKRSKMAAGWLGDPDL